MLSGRFGALRPQGCRLESHFSSAVGGTMSHVQLLYSQVPIALRCVNSDTVNAVQVSMTASVINMPAWLPLWLTCYSMMANLYRRDRRILALVIFLFYFCTLLSRLIHTFRAVYIETQGGPGVIEPRWALGTRNFKFFFFWPIYNFLVIYRQKL